MDDNLKIDKSIEDIQNSINNIKDIVEENNKNFNKLYTMIYDQTLAINNLIMAYNQNAIHGNATSNTTSSILKKMADMEIKIDNNDMPFQDIADQLSVLTLEISQMKTMLDDINLYGGQKW